MTRLPEPLRSQLVEALARLALADLEAFPHLPAEALDNETPEWRQMSRVCDIREELRAWLTG